MQAAHAEQSELSPEQVRNIATSAYLYFYSLVSMDVTRRVTTNVPAGVTPGFGPMNAFHSLPEYPPAAFKTVVRPNFDTLYSIAWFDLREEPIILSLPDTNGRYYLMPMLDMWTDVFASPGWRTTGTQAGDFALVPPGWTGSIPDGMTRIESPTRYAWAIGRTQTNGPSDYAAVHVIQAGYKLTPLSQLGKAAVAPTVTTDPSVDMKTLPKTQVDSMSGEQFFTYAIELTKLHSPHLTDQPIVAQLGRLGIAVGQTLDFGTLDPAVRQALMDAPAAGQSLMQAQFPKLVTSVNAWETNLSSIGVYGNYYLKRAIIAQQGLGANLPEDAVYPINLADNTGQPLTGAQRYRLHFAKGAYPPADAFWSLTLYDADGFQVPNALNRFAISSWMPPQKNADGSIDLYLQHDSPGLDKEANWLPAPIGPFNVMLRLYAPQPSVLYAEWSPPPVIRE